MKRLQNLSYKTLFAILFFALAGIVFFLKIGGKTSKVSAAWWDDAWHYRKAISITNSSGSNLTDFQVSISIGTSQLITDGKMQTDCDDIRITDINGNLLPYWIEENNPGCNAVTDTKIWLKATTLPTSGSTVYLYYGNTSADNNENGDNVFEFFDDFENGTSKWTFETGVTSSIITESNSKIITLSSSTLWKGAFAGNENLDNYYYESRLKTSNTRTGLYFRHKSSGDTDNGYYLRAEGDNFGYSQNNGALGSYGSYTLDANTWYNTKIIAIGTSASLFINNINQNINQTIQNTTGNIGITPIEPTSIAYYDYVFVRKYISTEPTTSNQSEELGTAPIAYWKFDEGVGTTAYDSTGNNNGTLSGSTLPEWQSEESCIFGKCLSFNGTTTYIDTNYNYHMSYDTSTSFSFWIKPSTNSTGGVIKNIIGKNAYEFLISQIDQHLLFQQWNTAGSNLITLHSTNFIQANQWYYITVIADSSDHKAKFFINSKADNTVNITNGIFKNITESVKIGRGYTWGGSTTPFFNGLIDEVKIYPYARTADQIKLDYNSRGSMSGSSVNLGVQSNTAPSLKSGLIAHYKFDEGNGTVTNSNTSPTSNISFGSSNPPTWVTGKFNKALSFGTNSVAYYASSYNSSLEYNGSNNLSFSLWINPSTAETNAGQIISKPWNGVGGYNYYLLYNTNRTLTLMIRGATVYSIITTDTIPANQWHHIAFTMDNSQNLNIYIDGKLSKTGIGDISNWSITDSNVQLAIGCIYPYANYCIPGATTAFNGFIDELKIYNHILTADEVKQDYNAGSAIQFGQTTQTIGATTTSLEYCIPGDTSYCASPVAEWNFEENTGSTAKDTSGNNNTGTFGTGNSAPTWTLGVKNKGSAMNFDGITNKYISLSNVINLGNTSWTVSGWAKVPSSTSGRIGCLLCNYTDNPTINLEGYNTSMRLYWNGTDMYGATNLKDNKWHYLTWIRDKTNDKFLMYLDGKLEIGYSGSGSDLNIATTFLIGSDKRSGGLTWHGQIDQLKIYNYARTPAQIAYDYNKGAPVGWWKFDECQGNIANDSSGVGNSGVISIGSSGTQNSIGTCQIGTSAAWTAGASGKVNASLNFDGTDDYVDAGNASSLNITNDLTLSTWIKIGSTQTNQVIAGKNTSSNLGYYLTYNWATNPLKFTFFGVNNATAYSNTGLNLNEWTHVVVVRNGTNVSFYINGKLDTTIAVGGSVNSVSNSPFRIGQRSDSTVWPFNGQIDDVRIYNYALTSEQVKQVYNGGAVNFQ